MSFDEASSVFLDRSVVERAEVAAERDQLIVGQPLVAEQQHGVVEPRAINLLENRVVNRPKIDTADLRAKRALVGTTSNACSWRAGGVVPVDITSTARYQIRSGFEAMDSHALALIGITLFAATVNGALGYGFSSLTVPVALLFLTNRVLNPALVRSRSF
jgi:hypothetical protein